MGWLAAATAGMSTLQVVGTALSAVSSIQQIQAGRQQARAYQAQAKQEELKGRRDALAYRQQGVEVLKKIRENTATVTARAAAGGLNPYSGSPQSLKNYAAKEGIGEFYLAQENAELALVIGDANAQQARMAASQARRQGIYSAIGTLGSAAMTVGSLGGPGASLSSTGGANIAGQTATSLPTGYGTVGAGVPSNLPAYAR